MTPKPLCAHPGCRKALSRKNRSGLCKRHTHAPGLCRCVQCLRKTGSRMTLQQADETARINAYFAGISNTAPDVHMRKWR